MPENKNFRITQKQFVNEGGQTIDYEAIQIVGYLSGEFYALDLKLAPAEKKLAKALLLSTETGGETSVRKATAEEAPKVEKKNDQEVEDWLNSDN